VRRRGKRVTWAFLRKRLLCPSSPQRCCSFQTHAAPTFDLLGLCDFGKTVSRKQT
jgi:hypothetical protein